MGENEFRVYRGDGRELRISLGAGSLDLRVWAADETGEWCPTDEGVSLSNVELRRLRTAMAQRGDQDDSRSAPMPSDGESGSIDAERDLASGEAKRITAEPMEVDQPPTRKAAGAIKRPPARRDR